MADTLIFVTTKKMTRLINDILTELNQLLLESVGIAPTNSHISRNLQTIWPNESDSEIKQRLFNTLYQTNLRQLLGNLLELKYSLTAYTSTLQALRRNVYDSRA